MKRLIAELALLLAAQSSASQTCGPYVCPETGRVANGNTIVVLMRGDEGAPHNLTGSGFSLSGGMAFGFQPLRIHSNRAVMF